MLNGNKQRRAQHAAAIVLTGTAFAAGLVVPMNLIDEQGIGKAIGTVTINEGPSGLELTPALTDLPPGGHGFHVHQNADRSAGAARAWPAA